MAELTKRFCDVARAGALVKAFLRSALLLASIISLSVSIGKMASAEEAEPISNADYRSERKIEFGIGYAIKDDEYGPVLAASYNFPVTRSVSVGVLGEYAFGDINEWTFGLPVKFKIGEGWKLTTMPGVERAHGESKFLFRVGVGYEFEMNGSSLTPELNVDFVDGETVFIVGATIGFAF